MEESSSPNSNFVLNSPELEISDMEETTPELQSYTSLKDLLSDTATHAPPLSPAWNCYNVELPIKNPLVKHAALAYLQPAMLLPPPSLNNHAFGCLQWLIALLFALAGDITGGALHRRS